MKALFEQITIQLEQSFSILQLNQSCFDASYHFHPEFELTFIQESYGKRFIGSIIEDYRPGDLVLVGSNIPHCWISEGEPEENSAQAIVFQFQKEFAGMNFWDLPELIGIKNILKQSFAGIIITGNTRKRIIEKMIVSLSSKGVDRFLLLIEILNQIAVSKEIVMIDQQFSDLVHFQVDTIRFQKVFSYLIENFRSEISLRTIAEIAHLTPNAFCRYFKTITHKTLIEMITEFRINHARRLLVSTDKNVSEICFESGFGNISFFNKIFKKVTGTTPLQYKMLFFKQS